MHNNKTNTAETTQLLKLLHIVSGDLWAGAEVQFYTLAKTLNKQHNVQLDVVLLNHGMLEQKLRTESINVTVLDESELNGFQILLKLINIVHKTKPDIIHSHRIKENILSSIAAFLNNTPALRTAHGAPEHKPSWLHLIKRSFLFMDWFCGRFIQKRIIAVSADLAMVLQKSFPKNKILIIENGIDIGSLSSLKKTDVLPNINNPSTIIKIGIAGRLVPVKRVDLFIKAAQLLIRMPHNFKFSFHIFGDGPLQDSLQDLSKVLQLDNMVHFEGHSDDIHHQLNKLDALLMTSDHEGLPMVLLEAMVIQVPVIAHAVGGIPNLLDHGKCGTLIKEHNARSYANSIYNLFKNHEDITAKTLSAFKRINNYYSTEINAEKYIMNYKQLLNE